MDKAGLEQLLRRARRRDPDALGRLVEVYGPRVFGLIYRLTGSRDAAEELAQETFLRVLRAIERYEHVGRFESWLFRIAANLSRDRARKRPQTAPLAGGQPRNDPGQLAPSTENDPARHLIRQEAEDRLVTGLQRLSEVEREVILLRHFSGLSFREIAEMLGIPLGTALARAHRALQRLRRELQES